jgi:hypothetical protein
MPVTVTLQGRNVPTVFLPTYSVVLKAYGSVPQLVLIRSPGTANPRANMRGPLPHGATPDMQALPCLALSKPKNVRVLDQTLYGSKIHRRDDRPDGTVELLSCLSVL